MPRMISKRRYGQSCRKNGKKELIMMTIIGRNILAGLERRGINQKELAERTGVSGCYISQIISGKREPSVRILGKLSEALDCTLAELLEDNKSPRRERRAG